MVQSAAAAAVGRESIADVFLPSVCPRSTRVYVCVWGSSLPTTTSFALMEKQRGASINRIDADFIANENNNAEETFFKIINCADVENPTRQVQLGVYCDVPRVRADL